MNLYFFLKICYFFCDGLSRADDPTFLNFKKGELIVIIQDEEFPLARGWMKGRNERTSKSGAVPADSVLILPTLTKPSNEVMVQ